MRFITVRLCAVVVVALGLTLVPTTAWAAEVTVYAARDWQSTDVDAGFDNTVQIKYVSGRWSPWPGGYFDARGCTIADGCGDPATDVNNVCPCIAHAGLIGRIGNSAPFAVGLGTTISAKRVGRAGDVQLRINDKVLSDDSGSIVVEVIPFFGRPSLGRS